jgi:hypothetical protein
MIVRLGGETFAFNTVSDIFRAKSRPSLTAWTFSVQRGGVLVEGVVHAEPGIFAGVTYEDTDGSAIYCHNTKIADMRLTVRRGNAVQYFQSTGAAAYEFVTRTPNPEIMFVL